MAKAPPSAKRDRIKAFVPALVDYTNDVVYGDLWERKGLSKRDRSLITVAALIATYRPEQLEVAPDARDRQRRHAGRDHRGDHASGVLCRLAGRDVGRAARLHGARRKQESGVRRRWRTMSTSDLSGSAPWAPAWRPTCRRPATGSWCTTCTGSPRAIICRPAPPGPRRRSALAAQCDVIFSSLPEPPDVEAVAIGADGLLEGMKTGAAYFDLSTNSPSVVKKLHAAFAEKGAHMLDAPVSGGPQGAASRQARDLGRRRAGGVRPAQGGARRDRRQGRLYRADRLRDGRQAGAQHVRLRHRLRARRDVRARREGRRRAARAVERGAPGRGRAALHLRCAGRSVPARQIRSAGVRAQARAQGCVARECARAASSACRCACATSRSPR